MARVTSLEQAADKFVRNATAASDEYAENAIAAASEWARHAAAAEQNYQAGVSAAIAKKAFSAGVNAAGADTYATGIQQKGRNHFGPGVAAARSAYAEGEAPFLQALAGLTYPPRRPKRSPENVQRVNAVIALMIKTADARR